MSSMIPDLYASVDNYVCPLAFSVAKEGGALDGRTVSVAHRVASI